MFVLIEATCRKDSGVIVVDNLKGLLFGLICHNYADYAPQQSGPNFSPPTSFLALLEWSNGEWDNLTKCSNRVINHIIPFYTLFTN